MLVYTPDCLDIGSIDETVVIRIQTSRLQYCPGRRSLPAGFQSHNAGLAGLYLPEPIYSCRFGRDVLQG
jgi:hypothetical protein